MSAAHTPAAQAPPRPCASVMGRAAARAPSARARIVARHHTWPAVGTCASRQASWRSSRSTCATSATSAHTGQAIACCRRSSSPGAAAGQRPQTTASSTSASRTQSIVPTVFLSLGRRQDPSDGQQRCQSSARPKQQSLDASRLQSKRRRNLLVRGSLRVGQPGGRARGA